MGLDIVVGLRIGDSQNEDKMLYEVMKDCLSREGLSPHEEPTESPVYATERAYGMKDLADHCNEHDLPYPWIRKITCSLFQMIVPVVFDKPIAQFGEKHPQDYGLWVPPPDQAEKSEEEMQKWMEEEGITAFIRGPQYPYYLHTPIEDVYLLSAQRLMDDVTRFLDQTEPRWRNEDFDWYDAHDWTVKAAALVGRACRECLQSNRVVWFSG